MKIMQQIDKCIIGVRVNLATPALLIMAARACVNLTIDDDEHILSEFRQCLLDARIQRQENAN